MEINLEEKIQEILEKTLYGFNEGCIGTSCSISIRGTERAVKELSDLVKEYQKKKIDTDTP